MTRTQLRFFRRCLREVAESLFLHDVINSRQCDELQSFPDREIGVLCATELFKRREVKLAEYPIHLKLKRLREINGMPFEHMQILFRKRRPRRICFVGHRFLPQVTNTLRWNLLQVFEPYNVGLDWSGKDIRSVQIFDNIVKKIKKADFCIFDNRATANRPNVYVEAGIAYAVGTPFILFDYARQKTESIPSDLSHSFAIRYNTYQRLFRDFHARLPVFFLRNFGEGR